MGNSKELSVIAPLPAPSGDSNENGFTVDDLGAMNPYRVYKRRFIGLAAIVLLNLVCSWDWLTFAASANTTADYFDVPQNTIDWLSTAFLFAFAAFIPVVVFTFHRSGVKTSLIISAVLLIVGNWIRYGGTRARSFGVVMFGQILIGFSQPFFLSIPTRYSDMWFSGQAHTTVTAVASLANPLGGALGGLIDPIWAPISSQIPDMVLYVSIISTVCAVPSFFIPARPPTPPSAAVSVPRPSLMASLHILATFPEFWILFLVFSVDVGLFNVDSTLINQYLRPYQFSDDQAGIAGALLIFVGLGAAIIFAPLNDRHHAYLLSLKILTPLIAATYLGFMFAVESATMSCVYATASLQGATSFVALPIILEFLSEITYPVAPELPASLCWSGSQVLGAIFVISEDTMKAGSEAHPPRNMRRALVFQACLAWAMVPFMWALGVFPGRKLHTRRIDAEQARENRANKV